MLRVKNLEAAQSPRLLLAHGGSLTDHPYGDDQSVATEGELEDAAKVPQLGGAECQHLKTAEGSFGAWRNLILFVGGIHGNAGEPYREIIVVRRNKLSKMCEGNSSFVLKASGLRERGRSSEIT